MAAFDKNSVQIDYAFLINPQGEERIEIAPCPFCGEQTRRKHRSVCLSCKRRVPPTNSRHDWEPPVTNPFAEISPLVVRERQVKEHKFERSRGSSGEVVRLVRRVAVSAAVMFSILSATPYVIQLFVGQSGMNQIKNELSYIFGSSSQEPQIATTTLHKS